MPNPRDQMGPSPEISDKMKEFLASIPVVTPAEILRRQTEKFYEDVRNGNPDPSKTSDQK